MRKPYFMGVDIGTYESKGILMDADATIRAYGACPHPLETPMPGYAEHDAESTWWGDLCRLSNRLISESGISPEDIASVGVSAIGPCCLPVDAALKPLRKAILYGIDCRAAQEITYLENKIGKQEVLRRFGTPLTTQSAGAKVLWIQNNEPAVFRNTDKFITGSTYLVAKLTGSYTIDRYTAATWVPLYNVAKGDWNSDLLDICRRDQLAECRWTHEIAGVVTEHAARETGLAPGTPVTAGTADAGAEAFSIGVTVPGDMMLMYGSSIFIIHVVEKFTTDERLWAGPYLFPGTYSVTAGMSCAGTLTRWFLDNLAKDIREQADLDGLNAYGELAKLAEGIAPGSDGLTVLPYFSGERTPINDPDACGVIFGLNLLHTRAHIYKAFLESIGYGINQHFEIFTERQMSTRKVMAVGGAIQNTAWLQIVSDITGKKQRLVQTETGAAYGNALIAALGVGHFKDAQAATAHIREKSAILPDSRTHQAYGPYVKRYARLYAATKELMHEKI
ncbi:MAG: FGGY-family carbohydrate kinase [Clostridia bacterium]|nr:FGGY-family carbohydrate kinase [Clostridia bacterium]